VLHHTFACIDGSKYLAYVLVDPEAIYSDYEITKIKYDVEELGVSLWVLADWFDERLGEAIYDHNAEAMTDPVSSGSELSSLNSLLSNYFIELGARAYTGSVKLGGTAMEYRQGVAITRFPVGGYLSTRKLLEEYSRNY
jgi:hypothetical protein